MACLDYKSRKNNTKHIKILLVKKIYDQKQIAHIMLNEQCKAMHDSAKLSYRGYTDKKYQFLN